MSKGFSAGSETTIVAVAISAVYHRLPEASSTAAVLIMKTMKRLRLRTIVMRPSEKTPHKANF